MIRSMSGRQIISQYSISRNFSPCESEMIRSGVRATASSTPSGVTATMNQPIDCTSPAALWLFSRVGTISTAVAPRIATTCSTPNTRERS